VYGVCAERVTNNVEHIAEIVAAVRLIALGPEQRNGSVARATELASNGENRQRRFGTPLREWTNRLPRVILDSEPAQQAKPIHRNALRSRV
jgi:hypothetical protein